MSDQKPCPSCGHCPTCGRTNQPVYQLPPYYPYTIPYITPYVAPTITWTSTGSNS